MTRRRPHGLSAFARALPAIVVLTVAGCASPVQRPLVTAPPAPSLLADQKPAPRYAAAGRPVVGVAFGGGSARGIAHVGVMKWLEEHRIPIDVAAGTSMGGLIGGSMATGMSAGEIESMLATLDWDELFGSSSFAFKNIRRKMDARAYPTRLEFGLKRGIVPPASLNDGEQVELLLSRIAAPYYGLTHFDELPTPFRAVAVDLVSAQQIVLDRGSLAQAMRATMSLPLIFPPVELDGRVLVDGGAMNNVPANVVRSMGADRVVAVNVGDLSDREGIAYTLLGLAGATLDAMMRASTKASLAAADVVIDVPLQQFGSLDWRRTSDLIAAGYAAAEAVRTQLLPLAVSETDYAEWSASRQARRRRSLPVPAFAATEGFAADDGRRLDVLLSRHVGVPFDAAAVQDDIAVMSGLDRYDSITWQIVRDDSGREGLVIRARPKPFAPPFLMLGLNLENTTSSDFRITATARYLAFDVLGSGSELRLDGTLGSNPGAAVELYQPLGPTPLFIAPYAGLWTATINLIDEGAVVARYGQRVSRAGFVAGVNLGARSDLRAGVFLGRVETNVSVGDPGLPEVNGRESAADLSWRYDDQDSPVIPSRGTSAGVRLLHVLDSPSIPVGDGTVLTSQSVTQLDGAASRFWRVGERGRIFAYGAAGTSFSGQPLPTNQFVLGSALRLSAYSSGQLRGDHFVVASGGYLHRVLRLPDFLGGPVFAGGWIENGDTFDRWDAATWRTNAAAAVVMDTLFGPVVIAGAGGFDGRWRSYIGVGRIFR